MALGIDEIRVILTRPGQRSLRYTRLFVGLTVQEAIRWLDSEDRGLGCLPNDLETRPPYFVNGEEVPCDSGRILKAGDVLKATDP